MTTFTVCEAQFAQCNSVKGARARITLLEKVLGLKIKTLARCVLGHFIASERESERARG